MILAAHSWFCLTARFEIMHYYFFVPMFEGSSCVARAESQSMEPLVRLSPLLSQGVSAMAMSDVYTFLLQT